LIGFISGNDSIADRFCGILGGITLAGTWIFGVAGGALSFSGAVFSTGSGLLDFRAFSC